MDKRKPELDPYERIWRNIHCIHYLTIMIALGLIALGLIFIANIPKILAWLEAWAK